MHTVEEIELRRQDRDGLLPEDEKEHLVLWLWPVYPKGRFRRTR
ncbi:MAG TPA: hypothetical protein VI055_03470 [Rubrobacter sp.]|jgi:hypothetical protein